MNLSNDKYSKYPILLNVKENLELSGRSQNTIHNYVAGIFRFLEFSNIEDLNQLDLTHFRNFLIYLNSTELNKKSINNYNSHIRYFYQAILLKDINPFIVPMVKSKNKEIDYLTNSQIIKLTYCSSADSLSDCIIKLSLCCGLRINEIACLKVSDIDTDEMTIFVRESKRNKSRYVPIDNTAYLALKRYSREYHLKADDFLFTFVPSKKKATCETIRHRFYRFRDLAGLPSSLTFHSLRHTFAVNYLNSGGELVHLKYLMGHGSMVTTSLYLHVAYNRKMKVPSAMDALLGGASHD